MKILEDEQPTEFYECLPHLGEEEEEEDEEIDDGAPPAHGFFTGLVKKAISLAVPSEVALFERAMMWWMRAMAGGWVDIWVQTVATSDIELWDYASARPFRVVGKAAVCRYYNDLLSLHDGELKLELNPRQCTSPSPGVALCQVEILLDWGHPHRYFSSLMFEAQLDGFLISRLAVWPADCPKPTGRCGAIEYVQGERLLRPAQLAPYRILTSSPRGSGPSVGPGDQELLLSHINDMMSQWESACLDTEWSTRWVSMALTEDAIFVDHTLSPRSFIVHGRDLLIKYLLGHMKVDASQRVWVNSNLKVSGEMPNSIVDVDCEVAWTWGDTDYRQRMHIVAHLRGMRASRLEARPVDLGASAGGRTEEEAVPWTGDPLSPTLFRQYVVGADVVQVSKPCSHNSWDNVRIRRGWIVFRCRECEKKWRQRPQCTDRCMAFISPEGCGKGSSCPQLHVHQKKLNAKERVEARDAAAEPACASA